MVRRTRRGSFVVALREQGEHPDVSIRFPISLEIAREADAVTEEVWATGQGRLARFCSLAIMGDYTSCYVGLVAGHRPLADRRDRASQGVPRRGGRP